MWSRDSAFLPESHLFKLNHQIRVSAILFVNFICTLERLVFPKFIQRTQTFLFALYFFIYRKKKKRLAGDSVHNFKTFCCWCLHCVWFHNWVKMRSSTCMVIFVCHCCLRPRDSCGLGSCLSSLQVHGSAELLKATASPAHHVCPLHLLLWRPGELCDTAEVMAVWGKGRPWRRVHWS